MPVINFNYKDFCKLVGKNYSVKELEETVPMMGMEWQGFEDGVVGIEVFPNRPDLLSVEGMARAYKSFRGLKTGLVSYSVKSSDYELFVDDSVKSVRPVIAAAVIKGIKLTENAVKSLMQLQEKLHLTHCRGRVKAAVGVHDLRAVKFPVRYSAVEPGSVKFIPLDSSKEMTPDQVLAEHPKGVKYAGLVSELTVYPMVLGSDSEVLSFPPIINSELTKVRPNTRELFIEVTGTDEFTVNKALNIVVTSLLDRGAKVYGVKVRYGRSVKVCPDLSAGSMVLDPGYCRRILGENILDRSLPVLLRKMGFDVEKKDKGFRVIIPCYRTDLMHPMDLVEEIAVAYGYENFEPRTPETFGVGKEDPLYSRYEYVKDLLAGFGFIEVYNWLLTNKKVLFDNLERKECPVVETLHPQSVDLTVCRDLLVPQLIEFLAKNKHNDYPQNVFEVGDVLILNNNLVTQEKHLGLALAHSRSNYSELKAILDVLFKELGVEVSVKEVSSGYFIPGRGAELTLGGKVIGFIGEVSPQVLSNYDLKVPVVVCELNLVELVK